MKSNRKLRLVIDNPPSGPSERFLCLTRNPYLPSPLRFEPTAKQPEDLVL